MEAPKEQVLRSLKNKMETKAVIYARVSSNSDRLDTTGQIEDLKKYAISKNIEIINIFEEYISGVKKNKESKF